MPSVYYKELRKRASRGKFFSGVLFFLKLLSSVFVILVLPLLVFLFFIFLEPREVPKLNDYYHTEIELESNMASSNNFNDYNMSNYSFN